MSEFEINLSDIKIRNVEFQDGIALYNIAKNCSTLDINSQYFYYLMCRDFNQTSVVAICNNEIIGFLIGYLKPNDPNCLFLWQGFVLEKFRKKSITSTMVKKLLNSEISQVVKSVEATICPSNIPSIKLIESITKEKKGRLKTTEFISAENFKGTSHEQELLYRIELPS